METPLNSVPTDNLYKFLALGGLALMMFSIWLYYGSYETENLAFADAVRAIDYLKEKEHETDANLNHIDAYLTDLEKADNLRNNVTNYHSITNFQQTKVISEWNEIKKPLIDEVNKIREQAMSAVADAQETLDVAKLANERALRAWRILPLFFLLGLTTSFLGFYLWYKRVQVYQDRILANEAENHPKQPKH